MTAAVVPLLPHVIWVHSYEALHGASTIHKTSEMIHIVQCVMVNIRFLLTIFEECAGNISINLQSCIMSKSFKLCELHGGSSDNFILLLCCQSGLNITQQCRSLESPYSLPTGNSLTTWKTQWLCVYLGDWKFSQWHCQGFRSCEMLYCASAWVVTAILKAVRFFKHPEPVAHWHCLIHVPVCLQTGRCCAQIPCLLLTMWS